MTTTIQSEPIDLTGFTWKGPGNKTYEIRDAVVRLLTAGESDRIDKIEEEADRRRTRLCKSLVRLGELRELHDPFIIDEMLAVDREKIERAIANLSEGQSGAPVSDPVAVSDPIDLNPGLRINGSMVTTARVKLLVKREIKQILQAPEDERLDLELKYSLLNLGNVTDRRIIEAAVSDLTSVDEIRLHTSISELRLKYMNPQVAAPAPAAEKDFTIEGIEIVSEPFALNPGLVINGQVITEARVRLLWRSQWTEVDAQPSDSEKGDLSFLYSIHSLGNHTDREIIRAAVGSLTMPDVARIQDEVDALLARFSEPITGSKGGEVASPESAGLGEVEN
jgi:hypothetical protein